MLFRNGDLTFALAGWWRRLWAGSGCGGVWAGPGLVWMGCGVFAAALLWGGRLLAAGHQRERDLYWINSGKSPLASVAAGGLAMLLLPSSFPCVRA